MQKSVNANPFAMMVNPEAVIAAVNRSDRLSRLKSHICRPLDKPLLKPIVVRAFIGGSWQSVGGDTVITHQRPQPGSQDD